MLPNLNKRFANIKCNFGEPEQKKSQRKKERGGKSNARSLNNFEEKIISNTLFVEIFTR